MSLAARQYLVNHPRTVFQRDSERADLLDPRATATELVALLIELVNKGHFIEFTAVRTDHHNDAALGLHSHANGYAADCWPLASATAGDYLDSNDARFDRFLADCARSPWVYQVGLAGSADTGANEVAAGRTEFSDSGADHVHLGAGAAP